jgi:chromosome segregation ATPase
MVEKRRSPGKSKSKPSSGSSKSPALPPSATEAGRFALLMEEMDHRNRATIDAVYSVRDALGREIRAVFEPLNERVGSLELAVKDMGVRLGAVERQVQAQGVQLTEMNARLGRVEERLDRVEERLDRVEARLDRVEARLDRVEERLDRVEERLDRVETKLDEKADKADILALAERLAPLERSVAVS